MFSDFLSDLRVVKHVAMRAVQSIHICFSIVVMSCGVFQVPFSLKCCLCRSDLLNLSIMPFLGKAGVHYSFFVFQEKKCGLHSISSDLYM